ncbi:hypothetical protein C8F04DRAFT_1147449 [Mycena alexandri]|uniref:Uncharacterized protein n=1 Tax=Mycena alexandri TaxID=1745969 RepID=A0AAD6WM78_9AGAR|nr:hypothetical protein C8F04DRAFT_1147449 [Mycena alexandri]
MPEDVFLTSPRKPPAHRRSAVSLRAQPLSDDDPSAAGGGGAGNGRFSLAHELAVAMMPEPSAGSKLLAEEFGIEFDEGAEGIDEPATHAQMQEVQPQIHAEDGEAEADSRLDDEPPPPPDFGGDPAFGDPNANAFSGRGGMGGIGEGSPKRPEVDAMEVLAQDLESTDKFLGHLRRLDAIDSSSSSFGLPTSSSFATSSSSSSLPTSTSASSTTAPSGSSQPELERLASEVIRRINDTARDRETQVRELLECEREFRRIAGEVGGQDVLGRLDAFPEEEQEEPSFFATSSSSLESPTRLNMIQEADVERTPTKPARPPHLRAFSQDWETDPDADGGRLGDAYGVGNDGEPETDPAFDGSMSMEDSQFSPPASPTTARAPSSSFSPTIPNTLPSSLSHSASGSLASSKGRGGGGPTAELASLRALTTSLVSSLTSISEHAQVNGAATAEAGRKIRALRNRLGGWRAEWEGAERSRGRIERWERGEGEASFNPSSTGVSTPLLGTGASEGGSVPGTPMRGAHAKRVDGRTVVAEHLRAFEVALAEAAVKTQAIMAGA